MELSYSDICLQSNPCQHDVEINGKPIGTWGAIKICQFYIDSLWPVPEHFQQYVLYCTVPCSPQQYREKYSQYYDKTSKYEARFGPGYKYNIPNEILYDLSVEIILLE